MPPKRILNVDLPYLPKGTELIFCIGFRKEEPVSNFYLIKFSYRGS